jgi:lipoyl(octanoyl) transferase
MGDAARLRGEISPDLSHFTGIVPCGIAEFPVTSAAALGEHVRRPFRQRFSPHFCHFWTALSTRG